MHSSALVRRALAQRMSEGKPGATSSRLLGRGPGWSAKDILCTHDRHDRPYEEQHHAMSVALVLTGTFQYRTGDRIHLLAPGALMLGNHGTCFECSHEHAAGDRCIAFHFTPEYFERIAADAGHRSARFAVTRVPPLRELGRISGLVAAKLLQPGAGWDDVALEIAARALALANHDERPVPRPARAMLARITDSIRVIEADPAADHSLAKLASKAGVGPYYFLRAFERITGITPHQFVLRARLRQAAERIAQEPGQIASIAFRSGFGDLSNFNHSFRAEFGTTPRRWRAQLRAQFAASR